MLLDGPPQALCLQMQLQADVRALWLQLGGEFKVALFLSLPCMCRFFTPKLDLKLLELFPKLLLRLLSRHMLWCIVLTYLICSNASGRMYF